MSGYNSSNDAIGYNFLQALFADKNYTLAQSYCHLPLSVTYQNVTSHIEKTSDFEPAFACVNEELFSQYSVLNAKCLFKQEHLTTLYMEVLFEQANIYLAMHLSIYCNKICSIHFHFEKQQNNEQHLCKNSFNETDNNKLIAALNHTGIIFWEYHPFYDQGTINIAGKNTEQKIYNNFTEMLIRFLNIAPTSHQNLISLHEAIIYGQTDVSTIVKIINTDGDEEWRKIRYSTLKMKDDLLIAIGTSENINELKQLEKRFSVASAHTGVYIWNYDIETRTLTLENQPSTNFFQETVFNNAPDYFIENELVHTDDILQFQEIFQRIERGEALISSEIRFRNPITNEYIWHQVVFSVALDNEGYPNSVIGTSVNIHNQKHAEIIYKQELQLLESENNSTLLSFVYSINDKKIIRIKSKIFQLDKSLDFETLQHTLIKLCPNTEHKELLLKTLNISHLIALSNKQPTEETIYFTLSISQDESIWVAFNIILIKIPSTMEIYAKISMKNVTEDYIQKIYLEKLSRQKYDYILRVNYLTGKYIPIVSDKTKDILSLIKMTGNYHHDSRMVAKLVLVDDEKNAFLEAISTRNIIQKMKEQGNFELLFRTKLPNSNSIRYKRNHVFMFDETTTTFCIGCTDVTSTYEQEQEKNDMLRRSLQLAKEANKAKSSFLASMSHDIRTPMNAIIGMVNLAIEDQNNKEQVNESLHIIKSSSEHLLTLINDILEMNRIESCKIPLNNEPFDIAWECANIANTFKGIVIAKEQDFKFEEHNLATSHIIGDISNFKRILTNLLGNAVKFTPKHGTIFFKIFQEETTNDNLALFRIEITDTGIGIAKDQLTKIFEPFQREQKNETIKNIEGTGLGLAIVKALVEMQGGAINVQSEKGKGTTFTLHISYEKAEKQELKTPKDNILLNDINLKGKQILLVEDHPVNILVASKLLEKMGANIIKAENGKIGVEKFLATSNGEIDFIFMDLQMPVMNGFEAAKAIRESKHPCAKTIPIIAMTANTFAEDIHNSLNAGMNAHIAKPITPQSISNTLKKLAII